MNDIVTRLRDWRNVHLARLHLLMEEAADEMERLSANGDCPTPDNGAKRDNTPATHGTPSDGSVQNGCTLTDSEREAVLAMACHCDTRCGSEWVRFSSTLRGLLERTK